MANEIIKQQLPMEEVLTISKAFFESGMFPDVKSAAQAMVKIQAGQELGIKPFAAMNGIHMILGKPIVGAGIIAAGIKASNKYNYRVKEMTDLICSIDFYEGKELVGNSSFTIADAKKAGTKNTDKFPKNMLFARAISNGVKWYAPDVFDAPIYTDEEAELIKSETTAETILAPIIEIPDELKAVINEADKNGLLAIWQTNTEYQSNSEFLQLLTARKEALKSANGTTNTGEPG